MEAYVATLEQNCESFLRHWGPISWRTQLAAMEERNDPATAALLHGLAGIEEDSFYMQKKLRYSGAARLKPVSQFNAVWMVEEAEHARALSALASKFGWSGEAQRHDTLHRDKRAPIALVTLKLASPYSRGMLAAYMSLGVLVEYIAIASYNALGRNYADENMQDVLRQMSRQEGRHLRFYRRSAHAILLDDLACQRFVRYVLSHHWRAPGIDLYGTHLWLEMFRPLLEMTAVRTRYMQLDQLVDTLPGLAGMELMTNFVRRCEGSMNLPFVQRTVRAVTALDAVDIEYSGELV